MTPVGGDCECPQDRGQSFVNPDPLNAGPEHGESYGDNPRTERRRPRRGASSCPIAGLMLLVGAMMIAVILYSARKMDENIVSAQTELIDNSINARLTRSLSELRSVAWWDEAVTKSRGTTFDPAWLDLEVGVFMTESFHHDRIMILDEQDRPVYGFAGESRTDAGAAARRPRRGPRPGRARCAAARNVSPRITDAAFTGDAVESDFSDRRYGRSAAAVVQIGDHGELASVMAITPSVDMALQSPRPRILVSLHQARRRLLAGRRPRHAAARSRLRPARPASAAANYHAQDRRRPARSARSPGRRGARACC